MKQGKVLAISPAAPPPLLRAYLLSKFTLIRQKMDSEWNVYPWGYQQKVRKYKTR